jgi:hypothetical protein
VASIKESVEDMISDPDPPHNMLGNQVNQPILAINEMRRQTKWPGDSSREAIDPFSCTENISFYG